MDLWVKEEIKFLSIFNVVKEFVEKKDTSKNDEIIKLNGNNNEYLEPNHYRSKPFEKSREKGNAIQIYKCLKCNKNYYSVDALEKHSKMCF